MRCESYAPPTDPRIIGVFVVGGVTHYTHATEGPLPQLPTLAMENGPQVVRAPFIPMARAVKPTKPQYLAAFATDDRMPMVPVGFASARHWNSPCPRHLARAIHLYHDAARRAVA